MPSAGTYRAVRDCALPVVSIQKFQLLWTLRMPVVVYSGTSTDISATADGAARICNAADDLAWETA